MNKQLQWLEWRNEVFKIGKSKFMWGRDMIHEDKIFWKSTFFYRLFLKGITPLEANIRFMNEKTLHPVDKEGEMLLPSGERIKDNLTKLFNKNSA